MSYARLRFLTAVTVIAGGILLGLGAVIFDPGTERWLGLGVGSGLASMAILASLTSGRGTVQRGLDALLVPIGLWALIAARTIELPGHGASDSLVKWLGLSAGAGIFAVGVIALFAHEVATESDLRWALKQLGESREGATAAEATSTSTEPEAAPEAAAPEPEPSASDPEADAREPEADAPGPEADAREPEADTPEPETDAAEPEADAAEPEPSAPEPIDPAPSAHEAPASEPGAPEPEAAPAEASNGHGEPSGVWLTPIEEEAQA